MAFEDATGKVVGGRALDAEDAAEETVGSGPLRGRQDRAGRRKGRRLADVLP